MSCKKLYLENSEQLCAAVSVLGCSPRKDGFFDVETDRTPLFPEGGGQRSDIGTMNGVKILHCREENGTVLHTVEAAFPVGETVELRVDSAVRRLHTQQHTGEHLLSYAFLKLFGAVNIGFHMSEDVVTIDLDRMMTAEEAAQAERYANEMVWADLPVRCFYADAEEAKTLPLRKSNDKLSGEVRIVAIGDGEMCMCCGTHFKNTAPVGIIKVLDFVRYKQGCRITFVCGALALRWFTMENTELRRTAAGLSVKPEGVFDAVNRKEEQITALHLALKKKNAALADFYAKDMKTNARLTDGFRIAGGFVPADQDTAKQIAERLCEEENTLAVLFFEDGTRQRYFCLAGAACGKSCRDVALHLNKALNAKGGGSPKTAQGSFESRSEAELLQLLNTL